MGSSVHWADLQMPVDIPIFVDVEGRLSSPGMQRFKLSSAGGITCKVCKPSHVGHTQMREHASESWHVHSLSMDQQHQWTVCTSFYQHVCRSQGVCLFTYHRFCWQTVMATKQLISYNDVNDCSDCFEVGDVQLQVPR